MSDIKILGSNIRELRKKRGLTQKTFAEAMSVSFQAVSNWERGIAPPDLLNALNIAAYFGVTVDDLFRTEGEDVYLGIDGGGTKTEFAVVSKDGYVCMRTLRSRCNPNDIGYSHALELLSGGIEEVLSEYPSLKSAFLGVAGASSGDYAKRLSTELKKRFPKLEIKIKNDAYNLFATDEDVSMAVISGTGSVVFVRDKDEYKRLGGWGHLLDGSGSAYEIGKDALCEALKEEDMREEPSILGELILKKLGTDTVWDHIGTVYNEGKPYIASLSSVVFDAYHMGDEKAERIIDRNAKALAELLNAGVRLYGAEKVAIASGGIFEHYPDIMNEHIGKYSDVMLNVIDLPPIYGACKVACRIAGCEISDEFYSNFKKTYVGVNK